MLRVCKKEKVCLYAHIYVLFWGGLGVEGYSLFFFCMSPHRAVGAAVLCVSVLADDTVALL